MSKYDDQYYIVRKPYGENQIFVKADQKTSDRGYHYKKVPLNEAPFFFENSYKEEDLKKGNKWPITEAFMAGTSLLINNDIREELKAYDIDGVQLYPSVYIDDDNKWHENYWYLNFYKEFRYFDKDNSDIDDMLEPDDDDLEFFQYSLDENILDGIPEERRLMFKMGGATVAYVFVHQKIVDLFLHKQIRGVRFFKVSDFIEGDQHSESADGKSLEFKEQ